MSRRDRTPSDKVCVQRRRGITVITVVGHLSNNDADELMAELIAIIAREGDLWMFNDWSEMTSYDSLARMRLTAWAVEHRDKIKTITIWSTSPIVRMGVSTAALALALVGVKLESASNRAEFEALLAAATKKRDP